MAPRMLVVGLGAVARTILAQGAGAVRPVLRPWCGTQRERWRVREWREVQGVAGRRTKRSARCTQEERSGHLPIESVGAEEEQKCAQQSA
eukprot:scaffold10401_cov65-Phaeocystis_antarctica.AAC.9